MNMKAFLLLTLLISVVFAEEGKKQEGKQEEVKEESFADLSTRFFKHTNLPENVFKIHNLPENLFKIIIYQNQPFPAKRAPILKWTRFVFLLFQPAKKRELKKQTTQETTIK